ncbi:hypothetical protein MP228_000230 [Amoeboaphelidium protococcarum]|nr:hypothetical protein MP228_003996 [Amoeboaphelidium protococcarum]KAI3654850.1 hypothetical protein MP228_000230 [Amoeboaphelidium protococcarum]
MASLEESTFVQENREFACMRCEEFQLAMAEMRRQHQEEMTELRRQHQEEIAQLRADINLLAQQQNKKLSISRVVALMLGVWLFGVGLFLHVNAFAKMASAETVQTLQAGNTVLLPVAAVLNARELRHLIFQSNRNILHH